MHPVVACHNFGQQAFIVNHHFAPATVTSNQSPNLLNQVKRGARQALHLKWIAVEAFQPFPSVITTGLSIGGKAILWICTAEHITFQIKPFGK